MTAARPRARPTADSASVSVLVVDDEPQLLRALSVNLRARGYHVQQARTGRQALRVAADSRPDVVVLDLGLPDLDGVEVVHGLRGWSDVPVIILSARETEADKVAALDAGADDYVTKPFGMAEFLARLRAAVRRAKRDDNEQPAVATPDFTIDLAARRVTTPGGEDVHLTPREWGVVELLVRNQGRLVTQRQVLKAVWGPEYRDETSYLRVHLTRIRAKLEPDPPHPRYFHTEPGMGYRFTAAPPA